MSNMLFNAFAKEVEKIGLSATGKAGLRYIMGLKTATKGASEPIKRLAKTNRPILSSAPSSETTLAKKIRRMKEMPNLFSSIRKA